MKLKPSFLSGVTITDINDAKKPGNIILQSGVKSQYYPWRPWLQFCEHARTLYIPGVERRGKRCRQPVTLLMAFSRRCWRDKQIWSQPFNMPPPLPLAVEQVGASEYASALAGFTSNANPI